MQRGHGNTTTHIASHTPLTHPPERLLHPCSYYQGPNGLKPQAFPLEPQARAELLALAAYLEVSERLQLDPAALAAAGPAGLQLVVSEHDVHTDTWADEAAVVRPAQAGMVGAAGAAAGALEVEVAGRVVQVQRDVAGAAAMG